MCISDFSNPMLTECPFLARVNHGVHACNFTESQLMSDPLRCVCVQDGKPNSLTSRVLLHELQGCASDFFFITSRPSWFSWTKLATPLLSVFMTTVIYHLVSSARFVSMRSHFMPTWDTLLGIHKHCSQYIPKSSHATSIILVYLMSTVVLHVHI